MMVEEKLKDAIKYCMVKKSTKNEKQAVQKIARALYSCDGDIKSLQDARILLNVLIGE